MAVDASEALTVRNRTDDDEDFTEALAALRARMRREAELEVEARSTNETPRSWASVIELLMGSMTMRLRQG